MNRLVVACALVWLASAGVVAAPREPAVRPIAIVLDDAQPATRKSAIAGIIGLGGRVAHVFDDLLVVELPEGREFRAYRLAGVREIAFNGLAPGRRGTATSLGRAAWNAIAADSNDAGRVDPIPGPVEDDALVPPAVSIEDVRAARPSMVPAKAGRGVPPARAVALDDSVPGGPFGSNDLTTSEFLAGAVSINVILVESDGSYEPSTENWSATREAEVVGRIAAGLEWIRVQEPQAALRFVYHVLAGRTDTRARTGYEPIRHAADPTGATGEDRWVKDVLARFGYATGDRFARSRAFAADTRRADGTDWAVNVFVVDSLVDTDGKFTDGRFAYTWIGGPHLVMTYDNGAWGSARMDMVIRHELLHAFYAFDEYTGSPCTCTEHRGYLDGENANCENCNVRAEACVMISNGDAMCDATRRQLGWADLDGDGVIDVVGQRPATYLDPLPADVCAPPVLSGWASVVAATNLNTFPGIPHPSISVNRIAGLEVRTDDAPWVPAPSADVGLLPPQKRFIAAFQGLATGAHRFEARAVDDHGNTETNPAAVDITVHGGADALGDTVRASRNPAGGVAMTWSPSAGAVRYRIYHRSTAIAGDDEFVLETSDTSWSDPAGTSGFYQVRPVDACGAERTD
jgi:hypothetical protein